MTENQMGPYKFQGVIGRGGMGTVYKAIHQDSGEIVAVKALSPTYSHDSHFRSRFESEIQALIKLDHPNIVRLLSYGQEDGNLYFAMELVEGQSLFHLQKSIKKFDWRDVIVVGRDVAAGLRHAHDRGIIHRDLKPGNLLKSTDGTIKITDFGIAKEFGADHNTRDNVLGTLDFMSPEQAKGHPVTVRSDLFSLGVVLYTMLSGKPPFSANSMEESLRNLTSVPAPNLTSMISGIPAEIEELISQLIEKRPESRIPTALVLLNKFNEIEYRLKHSSEAKTAHGDGGEKSKSNPGSPKSGTVLNHDVTSDLFVATHDSQPSIGANKEPSALTRNDQTVEIGSREEAVEDLEFETSEIENPDYFNTVTDEQRKVAGGVEAVEKESSTRGVWPLVVALIVVIGLAGFGVSQAFKRPSADNLYLAIVAKAERPNKVRDEISNFLEFYPDDERADEVKRLDEVAKAIGFYNRMAVRGGMTGENRLSKMEREFVKIVDLSKDDCVEGFSRLTAFVELHRNPDEADEDRKDCHAAAESYLKKLRNDALNDLEWHEESIDNAFVRARAASSFEEQEKILKAVIDLYAEITWAGPKVEEARELLERFAEKANDNN